MKKSLKNFFYLSLFLLIFSNYFFAASREVENENTIIEGIILKIITEPDNAEVYINNKYIGNTPLNKIRAKKGKYNIKIYKKFYKTIDSTIELKDDNKEFTFKLEKLPWEPANNSLAIKYFIPFFSDMNYDLIMSLFFSYRYYFPLEKHPLANFDFELFTGIINTEISYSLNGVYNSAKTKLSIVPIGLIFHYNFFRTFKLLSPYLGFGFGACIINIRVDKYEKTSLIFSIIGGINFFTNWPVSFQIEAMYFWLGRANIPKQAIGTYDNITLREEYFFKGYFVSFSIVGRF